MAANRDVIIKVDREIAQLMGAFGGSLNDGVNPITNPIVGSVKVAFLIAGDYYTNAREALISGGLLSGSSLVRIELEIICDLFYIHSSPEPKRTRYATAYVNSIEKYNTTLLEADKVVKSGTLPAEGMLKDANPWTKATIFDRVRASGPGALHVYDMLSYANHANPGMFIYLRNPNLKYAQTTLILASNAFNAIMLMDFAIGICGINVTTHEHLMELQAKLDIGPATRNDNKDMKVK